MVLIYGNLNTQLEFVRCLVMSDSEDSNEFATGGEDFAVNIVQVGMNQLKHIQKFTHVDSIVWLQFDNDKVAAAARGIIKLSYQFLF